MKKVFWVFSLWATFNVAWADLEHSKAITEEVFVYEGVIYKLDKKDAEIKMYNEEYALYPKSKDLRLFLSRQDSNVKIRALSSQNSTTQFQNQGKQIIFYYSSTKGANLYDKIAPKRFPLIRQEILGEPNEKPQEIYIVQNYIDSIPNVPCQIVQSRRFTRDRARSELLINLDKNINARLLSQTENELHLECEIPQTQDIFE